MRQHQPMIRLGPESRALGPASHTLGPASHTLGPASHTLGPASHTLGPESLPGLPLRGILSAFVGNEDGNPRRRRPQKGFWGQRAREPRSGFWGQRSMIRPCKKGTLGPESRTCLACKTAGQALFAVLLAPPSPRLTEPTSPNCTANRIWANRARPQHAKHVPESFPGLYPCGILSAFGGDEDGNPRRRGPQKGFWGQRARESRNGFRGQRTPNTYGFWGRQIWIRRKQREQRPDRSIRFSSVFAVASCSNTARF